MLSLIIISLIINGSVNFHNNLNLLLNPYQYRLEEHQQAPKYESGKCYNDVVVFKGSYIAFGAGGKIDYIDNSGKKTPVVNTFGNNLNSAIVFDNIIIVVGDGGIILYSSDGIVFTAVKSGTDNNLNGITARNGLIIAVGNNGTILISNNGKTWNSVPCEINSNIVSVSSNDSFFIGVTDRGEILRTDDGYNWTIINYNKAYSGYNRPCSFRKILALNNKIAIIGTHDDGSPAVIFSSMGNVWAERSLIYYDNEGIIRTLSNKPNAITYDSVRDQFFIACDHGEILSLPSCTKCNAYSKISENNLYAIVCNDDRLIATGENYSVTVIDL